MTGAYICLDWLLPKPTQNWLCPSFLSPRLLLLLPPTEQAFGNNLSRSQQSQGKQGHKLQDMLQEAMLLHRANAGLLQRLPWGPWRA